MPIPIWAIWLILAAVCFVIEILSISFFMFWPGVGATLAAFTALLGFSFPVQITVFAISTTIMLIFMKPLMKKFFNPDAEDQSYLNNKNIIGKNGIVIAEIDNLKMTGQVKVGGELWSAISSNDEIIEKGAIVIVEDIESVKLKVKKV